MPSASARISTSNRYHLSTPNGSSARECSRANVGLVSLQNAHLILATPPLVVSHIGTGASGEHLRVLSHHLRVLIFTEGACAPRSSTIKLTVNPSALTYLLTPTQYATSSGVNTISWPSRAACGNYFPVSANAGVPVSAIVVAALFLLRIESTLARRFLCSRSSIRFRSYHPRLTNFFPFPPSQGWNGRKRESGGQIVVPITENADPHGHACGKTTQCSAADFASRNAAPTFSRARSRVFKRSLS